MVSALCYFLLCYILFHPANSVGVTVFEDSLKGKQVVDSKLSFAKFVKHPYHRLAVKAISSNSVSKHSQCAFACVETVTCFSFNVAAEPDIDGLTLCELLSTDKFNASDKFKANSLYHHHSISTPCSENPCKNGGTCVALYSAGDFNCTCRARYQGKRCGARSVHLKIRSEGHDDTPHAEEAFIIVDGKDYCKDKRGHNIVAINTNGSLHSTVFFDTWGDSQAGVKMRDYINSLPDQTLVLVATKDSAEIFYHDALAALESIGAEKNLSLGVRSSWYLVGYKGQPKPAWVTEGYAGRFNGPLEVEMDIAIEN